MTSGNSMSIFKVCAIWRDARWIHALRNWGTYAAGAVVRLKALAPYALIELILPGGSAIALLLWLFRRRRIVGSVRAIAGKIIVVPSIYKSLPSGAGDRCVAPAFYESGSPVRVEHSAGAYTSNAAKG